MENKKQEHRKKGMDKTTSVRNGKNKSSAKKESKKESKNESENESSTESKSESPLLDMEKFNQECTLIFKTYVENEDDERLRKQGQIFINWLEKTETSCNEMPLSILQTMNILCDDENYKGFIYGQPRMDGFKEDLVPANYLRRKMKSSKPFKEVGPLISYLEDETGPDFNPDDLDILTKIEEDETLTSDEQYDMIYIRRYIYSTIRQLKTIKPSPIDDSDDPLQMLIELIGSTQIK